MIKETALAVLSTICLTVGQAENLVDRYANERTMVRQIPGSEQALKSYFREIDADTIYAIIFPPGNCPRCEAQINPLDYELKKADPKHKTVLISAYHDKDVAQAYNIKHGFKSDNYIYDTDERYKEFLSFSGGFMHIVFLAKISLNSGTVIAALESSDCTPQFISQFTAYNKPMPQKRFAIETVAAPRFSAPAETLLLSEKYPMQHPDSIIVSTTKYQPAFDGERLFFNDDMDASIYAYRLDKNSGLMVFDGKIKTDESENRRFVTVEDKYFKMFQEDDGVRYIPLTPVLIPDGRLAISYSLPNIFHTDHGTIGYMNESAILFVDPGTHEHKGLIPLLHSHEYFFPHFSFYATPTDIIIGCQRMTWPMNYERHEYENDTALNPFTDGFYESPTPIMAAFGIDSWKLRKLFGNLPRHAKASKTGDYFSGYAFDYFDGEIAYTDAVSGMISVTDTIGDYNKIKHQYAAFIIPDDMIAPPDSSLFYNYDCVTPYKPVFCRTITDMKLSGDKIHCIVRYGDHNAPNTVDDTFTYVSIDRKSGEKTEKRFPETAAKERAFAYGLLRNKNGRITPYSIVKKDGKISVNTFLN